MLSTQQKSILDSILRMIDRNKDKKHDELDSILSIIKARIENVLTDDNTHTSRLEWKKIIALVSAFFIGIVLNNVGYSLWRSDESSESPVTKACTCPSVNGNTGNILFVYPSGAQSVCENKNNFDAIFKEIASVLGQLKLANKQGSQKP